MAKITAVTMTVIQLPTQLDVGLILLSIKGLGEIGASILEFFQYKIFIF